MSDSVKLREFFYVDVDRVRSLLAQIQGGLIDAMKSETSRLFTSPSTVAGPQSRTDRVEEARSLQELLFVAFEDSAEEAGWISDLGPLVKDAQEWSSGRVHEMLQEGQLIRLTCDVQILDGGLFGERLKRMESMVDAIVKLTSGAIPGNASARQRSEATQAAKRAAMGGMSSAELEAFAGFVNAFVGDSIAIRFMPCGAENAEYGFSGALLGRREYIQEEREHLFSRYGNAAGSWHCLLQVAAIPTSEHGAPNAVAAPLAPPGPGMTGAGISRVAMEALASSLMAKMEEIGIVEGPRWPSVSVTPLGVYREVPRPS